MKTQTQNGALLLFRGHDWYKGLSAEEAQTVSTRWMEWFQKLNRQGKAVSGTPLEKEGRLVSGKHGQVFADGPFAESKEAIGGFFLLSVATLDEAVAIAQECPGLPYGAKIEVRLIAEECPMSKETCASAQSMKREFAEQMA